MKKFLYPTIALFAAFALVACHASTPLPPSETTATTAPTAPTVPQETVPGAAEQNTEPFLPLVLVENEDICFKITAAENDPIWGYTLKVYLENNTDKELLFTVDNVSVNRFMCDPFWSEAVSAGMKCNSTISWFESDLQENGISSVREIRLTLRVYDSKDFGAEDVFYGDFTINP